MDRNGVYATAAVGLMVESDFQALKKSTDVNKVIDDIVKKLLTTKAAKFVKLLTGEARVDSVVIFFRRVMDGLVEHSLGGMLLDAVLELIGDNANCYLKLGVAVSASVGILLKAGMDTDLEIKGKTETVKMFEFGGSLAIAGCSGGVGYTKAGETFDAKDQGIYFKGGASYELCSATVELYITADVGHKLNNLIADAKGLVDPDFKRVLVSRSNDPNVEKLFRMMDADKDEAVSKTEFLEFIRKHKPKSGHWNSTTKLEEGFGLRKKHAINLAAFRAGFQRCSGLKPTDFVGVSF